MNVLQARGLVKRFGATVALDGFDLTLEPGRIVGLIGPNGSGKTTALKSIMGLSDLDSGSLSLFGMDPFKERKALMQRTTYVADVGILPRWMKVADLIDFVAAVNPVFDQATALRTLDKTDIKLHKKVRTLSKGMNVQLHLALVLASNAELLVLDEPTLGLDILYRQQFYDAVLNDYFEEQRSILLTTHEVREIEHILTDVVFIHRGRAVLSSSMDALAERYIKVVAGKDASQALRSMLPLSHRQTLHGVECVFQDTERGSLAEYGELSTPNLTDLFVAVLGNDVGDSA